MFVQNMIGINSTIRRCNFFENMSVQGGSGIYLDRAGKVEIYQNNFIDNQVDPLDSGWNWADAGALYF